jgi:hypothetical protein
MKNIAAHLTGVFCGAMFACSVSRIKMRGFFYDSSTSKINSFLTRGNPGPLTPESGTHY